MKIVFASLMLLISSCSHHHKGNDHHHHDKKASCSKCEEMSKDMYNKNCAHSVLEGDTHVPGKDEFQFDHGGRTYYFSSQEKMEKFKANLEENVKSANRKWEKGW